MGINDDLNKLFENDDILLDRKEPLKREEKTTKKNTQVFCAKCGSPIQTGWKVCSECGNPVEAKRKDKDTDHTIQPIDVTKVKDGEGVQKSSKKSPNGSVMKKRNKDKRALRWTQALVLLEVIIILVFIIAKLI